VTKAWLGALALAIVACREPARTGDAETAKASARADADGAEAPREGDGAGPESGGPAAGGEACRDWSTLDVSTLDPLPKSDAGYESVLEEVWRIVLEKHYDPTLACLDWPALRLQYAEKVAQAKSRGEAYRIIDEMLQKLGQSHFRLFGAESSGAPPMRPASPPMHVRWIDGELVVVQSTAKGPSGAIRPGAKLLAIEDVTADAIIEDVRARAKRPSEISFQLTRTAAAHLSCDRAGQSRRVQATDPTKGDAEVVRMVECEAPQGELVTLGNLKDVPTKVEHRMLDERVGYLAFNVWMLPMVQRVKTAMTELRAQGMQALVLDLRGNPGGVGPMSVPVARMLLSEPGSLGALRFRDFTQEFNVEPDTDPFTGPVALLVDAGTASTSEIFAQGLRDLGRATVVGGEPSAGAALPSLIEELPGGAVLQYVVGDYRSPSGVAVEGKGVVPDLAVKETRKAIAAGEDPVLDAAADHLRGKLSPGDGEGDSR
jgi:carboxyl-terminal processing protease